METTYSVELEYNGERRTTEIGWNTTPVKGLEDVTDADAIRYMWEGGQYSCDCNRILAGGWQDIEDEPPPCGEPTIKARVTFQGEVVYDDFE